GPVTVTLIGSRQSVASVARVGRPSIAHATATGKVMLAFGPAPLPDGDLERFTDRTLVERKALRSEVTQVREQGWAQAVKERETDLNAIAAPVYGANGRLAAILGVQGPAGRFGRKRRGAGAAPPGGRGAAALREPGVQEAGA